MAEKNFEGAPQSGKSCQNEPSDHQRELKSSGIMLRIGRRVKSAVEGVFSLPPAIQEDNKFDVTCERATELLKMLHTEFGEHIVSKELIQNLTRTNEVRRKKDICINVFGLHNCGKSTLLNALIGEEFLPVYEMAETSVSVKVQHDSSIHEGVCYHLGGNFRQRSKSCPKLLVITQRRGTLEIQGAEHVYDYLMSLNKKKCNNILPVQPTIILKVNIPLLAENCPSGWIVNLIDNPGYGEENEFVAQLANASLVASSAYIYLIQPEALGGSEADQFFKELLRKDKAAIGDGRLLVVITKVDTVYSYSRRRRRGRRSCVYNSEMIREQALTSIKDAIGTSMSVNSIIPVCGEWALAASRLAKCLISDPENEIKERREEAAEALESFPHLNLSGGQQLSYREIIKSLSHSDLILHLENASGVTDLKASLQYIVGKACIKVWASKISAEFYNYLKTTEDIVISRSKMLLDLHTEKARVHDEFKEAYDTILATKKSIRATASKRMKKTSQIWRELEESYLNDTSILEEVKARLRIFAEDFKRVCQYHISNNCFGPKDFEKSIEVFLDNSSSKLLKNFDSSCQSVLVHHIDRMLENVKKILSEAMILCKMDSVNLTESYVRKLQLENKALRRAPTFDHIKLRVKIPDVDDRQKSSSNSCHHLTDVMDKPSLDTDTESKCDDDDHENSEYRNNPVYTNITFDKELLGIKSDIVNQEDKVKQTISDSSISSIHRGEDAGGVQRSPFTAAIIYRNWSRELDAAIKFLHLNMEMECENYFKLLKPKDIAVLYEDYCHKTNECLDTFEEDFSVHLEEEHKRIQNLSEEMDTLKKEYSKLQLKKADLCTLRENLLEVCTLECTS